MDNEPVEKLMEVVLQMRINLRQISETFQLQTEEIRAQLMAIFARDVTALDDCLRLIDEKLSECSVVVGDYKQMYSALVTMREKLLQLGAEPNLLPPPLPSDELDAVIAWRLEELRASAKL